MVFLFPYNNNINKLVTYKNGQLSTISDLSNAPLSVYTNDVYGDVNPNSILVLQQGVLFAFDGYSWTQVSDPNGIHNLMPFSTVRKSFIVNQKNLLDRFESGHVRELMVSDDSPKSLHSGYGCNLTVYLTAGVCSGGAIGVDKYIQILDGILDPQYPGVSFDQFNILDGDNNGEGFWWAYNGKNWHKLVTPTGKIITKS